jgi:hypothetical protein
MILELHRHLRREQALVRMDPDDIFDAALADAEGGRELARLVIDHLDDELNGREEFDEGDPRANLYNDAYAILESVPAARAVPPYMTETLAATESERNGAEAERDELRRALADARSTQRYLEAVLTLEQRRRGSGRGKND